MPILAALRSTSSEGIMCQVLQFPRCRDRDFVARQVQWLVSHSQEAGDRYLDRLISEHSKRMTARGIVQNKVEEECLSLLGTIRSEARRRSLRAYGGVA